MLICVGFKFIYVHTYIKIHIAELTETKNIFYKILIVMLNILLYLCIFSWRYQKVTITFKICSTFVYSYLIFELLYIFLNNYNIFLGLAGFDNPMRDTKTEEVKRHIGQVSYGLNYKKNSAWNSKPRPPPPLRD